MAIQSIKPDNSQTPDLQMQLAALDNKIKKLETILHSHGPHFHSKNDLDAKATKIQVQFSSLDMTGATRQQQALHRGLPALIRQVKSQIENFTPVKFDVSWAMPMLHGNNPKSYLAAILSHLLPLNSLNGLLSDKSAFEKAFSNEGVTGERDIPKIVSFFDNLTLKDPIEIRITSGKEWKQDLNAILLSLDNSNDPTALLLERENECFALIRGQDRTYIIDLALASIKAYDNAFIMKGISPYLPYRPVAEGLTETEQERDDLDEVQNNLKIYPVSLKLPKMQVDQYLKQMNGSTKEQKIELLLKIAHIPIDPTQQDWLDRQIQDGFSKLPSNVQKEIREAINLRAQKTVFNNNYTDALIENSPSHDAVIASLKYLIVKNNLAQCLNMSDFQNALEIKPVPVFLSRKDIVAAIKEKGHALIFNETQSYSDEALSKIIATEPDKIIVLKALHKLLKQASAAPNIYYELPADLREALTDHYNIQNKTDIPLFVDSIIYSKKDQFISVLTKIIDNYPDSLSCPRPHLIRDKSKNYLERAKAFLDLINLDINPLIDIYPSENVISWKENSIKRAYRLLEDIENDFLIHFRHRLWELTGKEKDAKLIIRDNPSHPMIAVAIQEYLNAWRITQ